MEKPIDNERIGKVLRHWADHNRGHAAEYDEWAKRIADAGHDQASGKIEMAARMLDQVNEVLESALAAVEDS